VFEKKWIRSKATKDGADEMIAKYDGEWTLEASTKNALVNDLGLVMKSKAKHAAIAARLKKPFVFDDKTFIVQYELNFQVIPSVWQNETHSYLLNLLEKFRFLNFYNMLTVCMSTCMSVSLYVMKLKAKHAAIAARLKKPFVFDDKTFIVQCELNFQVIPSVWQNKAPCLSLFVFFQNVFPSVRLNFNYFNFNF
jgi:hypothetical protein